MNRRQLLQLGVPAAALPPSTPAPLLVRHALFQQQSSKVLAYEWQVLELLLDKTLGSHGPYRLEPAELVSQNRGFLQLRDGAVDVLSSMSSREREQNSLPLRFCLYRGLLGVRLPIALASRQQSLETVSTLAEAKALRLAQVTDWPDAQVLADNGWSVEHLSKLSLFPEMLRRQRIDLFALGALEVYPIVDAWPDLVVLNQWLIAYPSAFYFFVSPRRPELAQRLLAGWNLALADGSFLALFERGPGAMLKRARLQDRRWLILRNPQLPAQTPLQDSRLWHPLVRQKLLPPPG